MSLLRVAGRTMLASFFILNGAKAALKPDDLVPGAEPIADRFVPLAQRVAPPSVTPYIPTDTRTLVRISGVAQVVGGVSLATGVGRRLGALVLAGSMIPQVIASRPEPGSGLAARRVSAELMVRNIALMGGALIAAQDTQGQPSLAWRAQDATARFARRAERESKVLAKDVDKVSRKTKRELRKLARQTRKQLGA